ncbi:MAG: carbohydrate ABC transporter permease, partial [Bifidobacterium sp.]|nr:carbohydrate ABC transporter permease [Bifidobacterium sp.]
MAIESKGVSPLLQRTKGEKVFNVFNIAFFILFAFICVYPFYYLIINSISDNTLSAAGKITVLPKGVHWS